MSTTNSEVLGNQHLVEVLEQVMGHPLSEPVQRAFLRVDRHHFVPSYYVQQGYQWKMQQTGPEVYEDRYFLTSLDQAGMPNSSSSQPSLMASMLVALDLAPGMRVLEIGTGTGYNAALIGTMIGPAGQVISVDVVPDLIERAAPRLAPLPWVQVAVADGLQGYGAMAPYDRIIVTGGSETIPVAWLEQLAVGGILIGSLSSGLTTATPLYRLVKCADGSIDGAFLSLPAFFMALHEHEQQVRSPRDDTFYEALPVIEQDDTDLNLLSWLRDSSFVLFVEQDLPGLHAHLYIQRQHKAASIIQGKRVFLSGQAMLTCTPRSEANSSWHIEVRGSVPLWSRIVEAHQDWERQGKPDVSCYHITSNEIAHLFYGKASFGAKTSPVHTLGNSKSMTL